MRRGEITREAFLLNLAKVWAGLPTPSGRSYYHGVAGNRAALSYDSYPRRARYPRRLNLRRAHGQ